MELGGGGGGGGGGEESGRREGREGWSGGGGREERVSKVPTLRLSMLLERLLVSCELLTQLDSCPCESLAMQYKLRCQLLSFLDQTLQWISGRPRIIAAPPEVQNEINVTLV